MPHSTALIATIVSSLVFAFALGFLAHRLRLPPLVGYLLAGVVVGPFTPGFMADANLAGQLAEIGVVLLMFGVGLHFSIKDLLAVHRIALPGAAAQIAVCLPAGASLGVLWGWGAGPGLLLGLALSVASTVVLLRVLEERSLLDSQEGRIAVGWLIVQDLAMVLALVLLPALAGRESGGGLIVSIAVTVAKVGLFGGLVVLIGRRVVPWLLAFAARTGSRELFTLAVLACALGIAYGSSYLFGVSLALGAFFAGVVLSESDLSHQAAANSLPLQDAFAVLFFASVGMLFDPTVVTREPSRLAAVLLLIVVVKSAAALAVVLIARQSFRSALTIAIGLAQVGEFSFILASLAVGLDLLPSEGRDLILAGALLSIVINAPLLALGDRVMTWMNAHPAMLHRFERSAMAVPERTRTALQELHNHAVVVGHGRVGGMICRALAHQRLPFVIVEHDRRLAEELRGRGMLVVWGDASAPGILEAAGIARARLLVLAAPDGFQVRSALHEARELNPDIDAVVRTHSAGELAYHERQGVGMAVMAERELALAMSDYALRSLGVPDGEARTVVGGLRSFARVGSTTSWDVDDARRAPELEEREDDGHRA